MSTTRIDDNTRLHSSKWLIPMNQSLHWTKDRFAWIVLSNFKRVKAVFHCSRFARAGGAGFENLLTRAWRASTTLDRFRKDDATSKTTWMSSFGANYRQLLVCHVVLDDFTTRKYNFHVLSRTSQIYASFEKNMRVCIIKIILFCSPYIV
jgi:hypothetical protein